MLSSLISLSLFASSTYALAYNGPRATPATQIVGDLLFPPEPTTKPYLDPELLKRQNVQTDLVAPDNTCGYISGLAGAAYYCYSLTDTCAFFPTTAGAYGFVGCCNTVNCGARLTCVDASQYSTASICDNGCEKDTFTLKCTASSAPYCNGIRWPAEGVQDYFCDNTYVSTWQTALTTYSNEEGRSFSPLTVTLTTTGVQTTGTGTGGLAFPTASTSSPNSISSPSTTATGQSQTGNVNPTTTSGQPVPTTATESKKSTPVGAIAGGTVGGVAVLAAAVLGIWFFLRKKKSQPTDAHGSAPPPSYVPQTDNSAYGAAAAGKPAATPQEAQYAGQYGPQGQQGYAPVPQQPYQQPYGQPQMQQQYGPPMAEAPGSNTYGAPMAAAGAGAVGAAAYDPHHSTGPQTPYSQHSQPLSPNSTAPQPHSPNSTAHLSAGYPDRDLTTSPMSQHRLSTTDGSVIGGSPQVPAGQYQGYTPYVPPTGQGANPPVEMMSGTGAGPWPTNLHEGTYEAPGNEHHSQ